MNKAYLLLGGNLGSVPATFEKARGMIRHHVGDILQESALYESEPLGFQSEDLFVNQVLLVCTPMQAETLMQQVLDIETALGRVRHNQQMTSRIIDIDLLFFNDSIIDQRGLQVPHPRLHLRRFTLLPLAQLAPDLVHPQLHKTIRQLLDLCPDHSKVNLLSDPINPHRNN